MKKELKTLSIDELKAKARATASKFNSEDEGELYISIIRTLRTKMKTDEFIKFIDSLT